MTVSESFKELIGWFEDYRIQELQKYTSALKISIECNKTILSVQVKKQFSKFAINTFPKTFELLTSHFFLDDRCPWLALRGHIALDLNLSRNLYFLSNL